MTSTKVQFHVWRAMRLAGVRLDTPGAQDVARSIAWIIAQQPMILTRFPIAQNDLHTLEGIGADSYWTRKFEKFMERVCILGLESNEGRQAVGEYTATALGLLASAWRIYGAPPSHFPSYFDSSALRLVKHE